MKLAALRDFIAVAERGSLRAAARALGNTQPAISRNIRELEKELGTTLFERYATGVRLTPMGQVWINWYIHNCFDQKRQSRYRGKRSHGISTVFR